MALLRLICACGIAALLGVAATPETEWMSFLRQGQHLLRTGSPVAALPLFEKALAALPPELGDRAAAAVISSECGHALLGLGRFREAVIQYERARAILRESPERTDRLFAAVLGNLGNAERELGRYARAESLLNEAFRLAVQGSGADSDQAVAIEDYLSVFYLDTNRYPEAERILRRRLRSLEGSRDAPAEAFARTLHNLGQVLQSTRRRREAEALYRLALPYWRQTRNEEAAEAATISGLAACAFDRRRFSEARRLLSTALGRLEASGRADHPQAGKILHDLAEVYAAERHWKDSYECASRAVALFEASLGPDHVKLTAALCTQARALRALGRKEEAAVAESRARAAATLPPSGNGAIVRVEDLRR